MIGRNHFRSAVVGRSIERDQLQITVAEQDKHRIDDMIRIAVLAGIEGYQGLVASRWNRYHQSAESVLAVRAAVVGVHDQRVHVWGVDSRGVQNRCIQGLSVRIVGVDNGCAHPLGVNVVAVDHLAVDHLGVHA